VLVVVAVEEIIIQELAAQQGQVVEVLVQHNVLLVEMVQRILAVEVEVLMEGLLQELLLEAQVDQES
tara:strand:- start:187 stop:387 length:201 start_codon:yes stop_codon:yes gene_type:complete